MPFERLSALPEFTRDRSTYPNPKYLIWSAEFDPPAVGEEITIRINAIGRAKVTGYAAMDGYLGVMVAPLDPPEWWVNSNGPPSPSNDGLAFGAEISL